MKIPIKWLQQYVDINVSHDELFERLTMAGLEVEQIDDVAGDTVFEIEVTPNRSDLLSMLGIAQEVSAVLDQDMRYPTVNHVAEQGAVDITIEDAADCARYIGTKIDGVKVGQTPNDIATKLRALNMSGVNNVVDITNFSLFENGQPLHAFDYDKLAGGKIIVRRARKGEKLLALDDITYELDESILVIADAQKPVAIAGIMGGKETGVTTTTKNILLESAYFDMTLIRRTSRKLGLSSDSCYRFERGVDFKGVAFGSNRATALIQDIAGGAVVKKTDCIAKDLTRTLVPINLSQHKINQYLGATIAISQSETILKRLAFDVNVNGDELAVRPPHYRNDVVIVEDVIEEVGRIIGYDNLPSSLPLIKAANIAVDHKRIDIKKIVNEYLRGLGYSEVIPFSMTNQTALEKCEQGHLERINIKNPLSLEQEAMRPSMLPSLMGIYQTNINRGCRDVQLFEVGKIYPVAQDEQLMLGIFLAGKEASTWRHLKRRDRDFYDLKGVVEGLLDYLNITDVTFVNDEHSGLTKGQVATINKDGQSIGYLGAVSKNVLANWSIKKSTALVAFLDLNMLDQLRAVEKKLIPLSEYPAMTRDISMAVAVDVEYDQIKTICLTQGGDILKEVSFIELYMGDKIDADQKGIVISLTYRSDERTLVEDEVNEIHETIRATLESLLGVQFR